MLVYSEDNLISDMACIITERDRVVSANLPFLSLTGYNEKDIAGRKTEELWHDLLRINVDFKDVERVSVLQGYLFDITRNVKEVHIKHVALHEPAQKIYTFKEIRNEVLEKNFPFLELVNAANDNGLAICSVPDFVLLKANNSYFRNFSKTYSCLGDILGRRLFDITPSVKYSSMHCLCEDIIKNGQPVYFDEGMMELPDTGKFYARYTLSPIFEEGRVKYIVFTHNDVTEKVNSRNIIYEKNLIIEEQKKRITAQRDYIYKLFNTLDMPIISLSYPDFKVKEYNKKALEDLRELNDMGSMIIESHLSGRSLVEAAPLIREYDETKYIFRMEQTKATVCHDRVEFIKNGKKAYYNMSYYPMLDIDGEIKEILVLAVDVTCEVEKGKHLEEIMKLKDEFLCFMSHEFKTPLTVINAAVQSLDNIYASQIPPKAKAMIDKIRQNTYRQLRLVNNLLEITRINSGKIKLKKRNIDVVLLAREITESVAIYAQQKGVEINFISKLGSRLIGLDDEKFERIILNLLSNAIKFTQPGKKITVELSSKLHKSKRMICIRVIDQGIGIPKDKQSMIFERFGQVDSILAKQAEGSGIGLYLVKLMINAFEGEIMLESEEGKGSTFTLLLPAVKLKESKNEYKAQQFSDSRLVQSLAIEFSDIYM